MWEAKGHRNGAGRRCGRCCARLDRLARPWTVRYVCCHEVDRPVLTHRAPGRLMPGGMNDVSRGRAPRMAGVACASVVGAAAKDRGLVRCSTLPPAVCWRIGARASTCRRDVRGPSSHGDEPPGLPAFPPTRQRLYATGSRGPLARGPGSVVAGRRLSAVTAAAESCSSSGSSVLPSGARTRTCHVTNGSSRSLR